MSAQVKRIDERNNKELIRVVRRLDIVDRIEGLVSRSLAILDLSESESSKDLLWQVEVNLREINKVVQRVRTIK